LFQAEDGIRDFHVTGVQTCALPIYLGLPRMDGIEVTREVKARWPQVEILIFTIFDEEEKVLDAVKAGASGYLLKGMPAERITERSEERRVGKERGSGWARYRSEHRR